MTITELLELLREKFGAVDASQFTGVTAVQVDITGGNAGSFYIEIKDGVINMQPYEYLDRNAKLIISMDNFLKLINKKLDPVLAFTLGKLKVEGDVGKILEITKLL